MPEQKARVEEAAAFPAEAAEETRRSLRALRRAFAEVVFENLRFGLPVIQYKDGKVLETPAEQLVPLARRILEVGGDPIPEKERRELLKDTVWDDERAPAASAGTPSALAS